MASAKDLRKRIASVKNTQQITKAMKMVAAAKLRRAQENIVHLRPYAHELNKVIVALSESGSGDISHPLLVRREETERKKILVVLVTSDRGLCGAFNGNVIKTALRFLKNDTSKYGQVDFAFIGKKGYEFFKNKKTGKYYSGFFQGLTMGKAQTLATELIDKYQGGEYDEIRFIYNEFKTAISQKVNFESFLPVEPLGEEPPSGGTAQPTSPLTIYEPGPAEILESLLSRHFAIQIYRIALESLASEHGARMAAMENATRNAGEMIRKITLLYNKTRQAGITKELLEIVSGSEAQKG